MVSHTDRKEYMPTIHRIRIARQLTAERAMELLREHGSIEVTLADLAAAWNPASTKGRLFGPMEIRYTLHPDGGVNATILG